MYGCGDAVIGVNPATESVETVSAILHAVQRLIDAYNIPTQACCLAHISTQLKAMERGAPLDLLFQSVAGTQKANESFGITLSMLREGRERVAEHHKQNISPRRPGDAEKSEASRQIVAEPLRIDEVAAMPDIADDSRPSDGNEHRYKQENSSQNPPRLRDSAVKSPT